MSGASQYTTFILYLCAILNLFNQFYENSGWCVSSCLCYQLHNTTVRCFRYVHDDVLGADLFITCSIHVKTTFSSWDSNMEAILTCFSDANRRLIAEYVPSVPLKTVSLLWDLL